MNGHLRTIDQNIKLAASKEISLSKKYKVLVVGYTNSIHFWKWCYYMKESGFTIDVLSYSKQNSDYLDYSIFNKYHDLSEKNVFLKFLLGIIRINFSGYEYINFQYMRSNWILLSIFSIKKNIFNCWGSDILVDYRNAEYLRKFIFDLALIKSYGIIFDSESVRNVIMEKCSKIDIKKMYLIYWGIDPEKFSFTNDEEKKTLRRKYNIPENSILLLSIRKLSPLYSIKEIINWFKEEIADKNILLYIRIPENSETQYVMECKRSAESNKNILFDGTYIPHSKINELYKIADISLHFPKSDATPVSILEGISCGNIIICDDKIVSYKILNEQYNMILSDLHSLKQNHIIEFLEKKYDIIQSNREKLIKLHSENVTIQSIKRFFYK